MRLSTIPRSPLQQRGDHLTWERPNTTISILHGQPYKEIFKEGVELIKSLGIFYWVSAGTALGLYRNSSLIEEDTDLDIGIYGHDFSDEIEYLFIKHGFIIIRTADKVGPMQRAFQKDNVIFDIAFYHKDLDGTYFNSINWGELRKPAKILENFEQITYDGETYNIPQSPEYFEWRYGKDWRIPKKGFKGIYAEAVNVTEQEATEKKIKITNN
jgi:hypothetical protein